VSNKTTPWVKSDQGESSSYLMDMSTVLSKVSSFCGGVKIRVMVQGIEVASEVETGDDDRDLRKDLTFEHCRRMNLAHLYFFILKFVSRVLGMNKSEE
jgi:hypothetical protein